MNAQVTDLGVHHFVEVAGIEPASASVEPGLLRAQSAAAFLSPGDLADESPSRAQSLFMSRRAP